MTFSKQLVEISEKFWEDFQGRSNSYTKIKNYLECYPPRDGDLFLVEEPGYIDKDYLIDFTNFYARCFEDIDKKVTRIHFFKSDKDKLVQILDDLGEGKEIDKNVKQLNEAYLGFIIKKPIFKGKQGKFNGAIGRSVLRRYPEWDEEESEIRVLKVSKRNIIHLFGIPLELESLPFQEQDRAVAACATVSIWTALQALQEQFNISVPLAPSEITAKAFEPGSLIESMKFPNEGLNIHQIKSVFSRLGYEILPFKLSEYDHDFVSTLLKAYLEYGIPIIAVLELTGKDKHEKHATVISGYKSDENKDEITRLFVHDDNIGPYSKVKLKNNKNLLEWNNEWISEWEYTNVEVKELLIPLYHKIRLSYTKVYYNDFLQVKNEKALRCYSKKLFLTDTNKYKSELLSHLAEFRNKEKIKKLLLTQLPRFFWVIRIEYEGIPVLDWLFDATTNIRSRMPVEF